MKLRELLTIAALGMLVGAAYAFMQNSDEQAAKHEQSALATDRDRDIFGVDRDLSDGQKPRGGCE